MNTIKILSKNKRIRDTHKRIKRHNSGGKYIWNIVIIIHWSPIKTFIMS